jgi:hypothetical protein
MIVQMPNGRVIQFPDSMSDSDVSKALKSLGGSPAAEPVAATAPVTQPAGLQREVNLTASEGLKGVAQGAGAIGDLASVGNALGAKYLPDWLTHGASAVNYGLSGDWMRSALPGGANPNAPLVSDIPNAPRSNDILAVTNKAGLTNRPDLVPTGQDENLLAAGARGVGSMLPFGLGAGPAGLAKAAATGLAGGEVGELTHEALPGNQIAPAIAGAVGGLGVAGLIHAFGGNPFSYVAAKLGSSENAEQAGEAAQDAVRNWRSTELPTKLSALAAPLDAKVGPQTPVNLANFGQTVKDMATKSGQAQPLSALLSSKLPEQLQSTLAKMAPTGTGVALDWQDARALRGQLGDLVANPKLIQGADPTMIKGLYKSLTEDLGSSANAAGAGDEWANFNSGANKLYQIGEQTMGKIASDVNPANETILPGNAASSLWNGMTKDSTHISRLRAETPDAANELAAGFLSAHPEKWPKLSDESKAALVPDAADRAALDAAAVKPVGKTLGSHGIQALAGGWAGEHLGNLANTILGTVPPDLVSLAGMGAPLLWHGGVAAAKNPQMLKYPLGAAIAGQTSNPLLGGQ